MLVFVGRIHRSMADGLLDKVRNTKGKAAIVQADKTEIGFSVELVNHTDFRVADFDGLQLGAPRVTGMKVKRKALNIHSQSAPRVTGMKEGQDKNNDESGCAPRVTGMKDVKITPARGLYRAPRVTGMKGQVFHENRQALCAPRVTGMKVKGSI